jgi:hypothetical protein
VLKREHRMVFPFSLMGTNCVVRMCYVDKRMIAAIKLQYIVANAQL